MHLSHTFPQHIPNLDALQERAVAEGERVSARITMIARLLLAAFLAVLILVCVVPYGSEFVAAWR